MRCSGSACSRAAKALPCPTMERTTASPDISVGWTLPFWAFLLGAAGLCPWQGWLTLALFGDDPWRQILSNQPIVSGVHPQHLYIGSLGADGLLAQWRTIVYDFAFQAGWPKTPIFDGGRLAELFLVLGGGSYQPAAYKLGFAICCFLVPLFFLIACKGVGLGNGSPAVGDLYRPAHLVGPAWPGGAAERRLRIVPGVACRIGPRRPVDLLSPDRRRAHLVRAFSHRLHRLVPAAPLVSDRAAHPVDLLSHRRHKHDFLTWHVAFWGVEALALGVNLPWLTDWFDSWWLRTSLPSPGGMLEHRTFTTLWNAPLWGDLQADSWPSCCSAAHSSASASSI